MPIKALRTSSATKTANKHKSIRSNLPRLKRQHRLDRRPKAELAAGFVTPICRRKVLRSLSRKTVTASATTALLLLKSE